MSISIATLGMFNSCCGRGVGGGGAPPYHRYEEPVKPTVLVQRVKVKTINTVNVLEKSFNVKLLDMEE